MKRKLKTLTEQFTDARSDYNRILGRGDKQLMNEQVTCPPGTKQLQMTPCPGSTNAQGAPISGNWYTGGCATIDGQEPNQSHIGTIVHNLSSGHVVKFEVVQIHSEYGNAANPTRHFTTTTCSGGTTGCDQTPASACAQQWFQNPNASWAANWMASKDCTNYAWPATNLETQAIAIMAGAPTPQTGPYNNWNDIWTAGQNSGLSPANQFIAKMAKAKYAQCQIQACNC